MKKLDENIKNAVSVLKSIKKNYIQIKRTSNLIKSIIKNNKLIVIGNGGSDSAANHFVTELTCGFSKKKIKSLPAMTLANSSNLSAWSNDHNFKTFFSKQISAIGKKNDLLIVLSTSGGYKDKSSNLIEACKVAKKKKIQIAIIIGNFASPMTKYSNLEIKIQSKNTSIIQLAQQFILDQICYELNL